MVMLSLPSDAQQVPANDNFAGATPLTTTEVSGSQDGATFELGEPSDCATIRTPTVWFTYTPETSVPTWFKANDSTRVAVYESDVADPDFDDLIPVGCGFRGVRVDGQAGRTQWLQVSNTEAFTLQAFPNDATFSFDVEITADSLPLPESWPLEIRPTRGLCPSAPITVDVPASSLVTTFVVEDLAVFNPEFDECKYEVRHLPVEGWQVSDQVIREEPLDPNAPGQNRFTNMQSPTLANALEIPDITVPTTLDARGSRLEAGESTCPSVVELGVRYRIEGSTWSTFVADQTGIIRLTDRGPYTSLALYTATVEQPSVRDLELLSCSERRNSVIDAAIVEGQRYWIQHGRFRFGGELTFVGERLDDVGPFVIEVRAVGASMPAQLTVQLESANCDGFEPTVTIDAPTGIDSAEVMLERFSASGEACEYVASVPDLDGFITPAPEPIRFVPNATEDVVVLAYRSPDNDDLANAMPLDDLPAGFEVEVDLGSASVEDGEPFDCLAPAAGDGTRWFAFSPTRDELLGATGTAEVNIYRSSERYPTIDSLTPTCEKEPFYLSPNYHYFVQVLGSSTEDPPTLALPLTSDLRAEINVNLTLAPGSDPNVLPDYYEIDLRGNCQDDVTMRLDDVTGSDTVTFSDLPAKFVWFYGDEITYVAQGSCNYGLRVNGGPDWRALLEASGRRFDVGPNEIDVTVYPRPENEEPTDAAELELPAQLEPDLKAAIVRSTQCRSGRYLWYRLETDSPFRVRNGGYSMAVFTSGSENPSIDDLDLVTCNYRNETVVKPDGPTTYYLGVTNGISFGDETPVVIDPATDEQTFTIDLAADQRVSELPQQAEVQLVSTDCGVDLSQTVTINERSEPVEFPSLPEWTSNGERCDYVATAQTPEGWTNPTAAVGPVSRLTYNRFYANTLVEAAIEIPEGQLIDTPYVPSEPDDQRVCVDRRGGVWYRWTAPSRGTVSFSGAAVDNQPLFDAALGLLTSAVDAPTSLTQMSLVDCLPVTADGAAATSYPVEADETYWIRAEGVDFTLNFTSTGPLACDSLDAAAADGRRTGTFELRADGLVATPKTPNNPNDFVYDSSSNEAVEYCFAVPRSGSYYVRLEMLAADNTSDSFWIAIDDGEGRPVFVGVSDEPVPTVVRDANNQPLAFELDEGDRVVRVVRRERGAALARVWLDPVEPPLDSQVGYPDGPHPVPGTIEAENYDEASQPGISYNDLDSGNFRGAYRSDDVDIWPTFGEGGFTVGRTQGGEWLEYTITVAEEAEFDIGLRAATGSSDPGGVEVRVDDQLVGEIAQVPATGWWNWSVRSIGQVTLAPGDHVLRIDITGNGQINLDRIEVRLPISAPTCLGPTQQAEGGAISGVMRIEATAAGVTSVGTLAGTPGEYAGADSEDYVEFCVTGVAPGLYELDAVVRAPSSRSDSFYIGVNESDPVTWHIWPNRPTFETRTVSVGSAPVQFQLDAGDNVVRFYYRESGTELDRFTFRPVG